MCAGAAVAALSLAPSAGAAPAAAHERALPALTARVVLPTTAYGAPRRGARRVMALRGATAWTGSAQRLLVTGRHTDARGRAWVRVQLPIRPNGAAGWVRADRVRLSGTRVRFEVHLRSRRLEIWRGARLLHRFRAGVGRPGTPTPVGRFAIQDPVPTLPGWRSVYGAWTLTLTAHSEVLRHFMGGDGLVAIHGTGTGRGWRVGQPSSNGCVILGEPELAVAARYARAGTPVVIDRS
ncbi:MAG TPA: L,D-transpeptidase [Miltoncostaea sp.]|nr:L,D-transpeptidase [Miltoncostaea sp.]